MLFTSFMYITFASMSDLLMIFWLKWQYLYLLFRHLKKEEKLEENVSNQKTSSEKKPFFRVIAVKITFNSLNNL